MLSLEHDYSAGQVLGDSGQIMDLVFNGMFIDLMLGSKIYRTSHCGHASTPDRCGTNDAAALPPLLCA